MLYVGIRLGGSTSAWCAKRASGESYSEGVVPADEDGLAKQVLVLGTDVTACVDDGRGGVGRRPAAGGGLADRDCRCSQGQSDRAVGAQDRQGRRVGAPSWRRLHPAEAYDDTAPSWMSVALPKAAVDGAFETLAPELSVCAPSGSVSKVAQPASLR